MTGGAVRAMVAVGKPFGVRIGFEFLGFATCSVNTLAMARQIVEAVRGPTVGLVLDAFHFYVGGATVEMLAGLKAEQLFLVHLGDAQKRPRPKVSGGHPLFPREGGVPARG